ncbi:MAG: hypothetical protein ACK41F_03430 [Fimbriimonadaceae bacterium]
MDRHAVHYLPILTTALSAVFCIVLLRAAMVRRSGPHLWWWAAGVFFYGLGTALESTVTLGGNSVALTKAWYIAGALLGGYPLAQGVAYLLLHGKIANLLAIVTLAVVALASLAVILSPADLSQLEPHRPTGAVIAWKAVRWTTPLINLYAFVLLVGGAAWSARRYAGSPETRHRAVGNAFIAVGALLPGVGGAMAKGGLVEALYVGECVGLILIWIGYGIIAARHRASRGPAPQ